MRREGDGGERGFTLLEVVVATAILTAFMGMLFSALKSAQDVESRAIVRADLEQKARLALDRVARELQDAVVLYPEPRPVDFVERITFSRLSGFDAAGIPIVSTTRTRIESALDPAEVDDDLDNNGDGLADERRLLVTYDVGGPSERVVVVATGLPDMLDAEIQHNGVNDNRAAAGDEQVDEGIDGLDEDGNGLVDEPAFSMTLDDTLDLLTIRLTLARRTSKGEWITAPVVTSVRLRGYGG